MAHLRGPERARYVARTFGRIAGKYDLLNGVMSAGRHHAWRRYAAKLAVAGDPGAALDLATGTGDFALELLRMDRVTEVVGVDFAPEMLGLARAKAARRCPTARQTLLSADAHALPFANGVFACATLGFGLRNFVDAPAALREVVRVLKPGGRLAVLEIVRAEGLRGRMFSAYFRRVMPWLGAVLARDREAYTYLPESVAGFLTAGELAEAMRSAGLGEVRAWRRALGSVAIVAGRKSSA